MSGFAALYHAQKPCSPEVLEKMTSRIAHRGPHGQKTWFHQNIGLAHSLLRATAESQLENPLTEDVSRGLHLLWDGRIDNRETLLRELSLSAEMPDARLALECYARWGKNAPEKILGDFSFLIWDQANRRLFGARDRVGIKPFYYIWTGAQFAASSEIKPLFYAHEGALKPNKKMILALLSYSNFLPEEHAETLFEGIFRLAPGHTLTLEDNRLSISKYWSVDPSKTIHYENSSDYAAHFRQIFQEAVQARTRTASKTAILLSGGLDSAAVTMAAAQKNKSNLFGINFYSKDFWTDERKEARLTAQKAGIPLYEMFSYSADPLARGLDQMLWKLEAPMISHSMDCEPLEFAKDRGVTAALSGEGGDHVLDEFGFPSDLLAQGRFSEFLEKTQGFADDFGSPVRLFWREAFHNMVPSEIHHLLRRFRKNAPPSWLNAEGVRQTGLADRFFSSDRTRTQFSSFVQYTTHRDTFRPYSLMLWETEERFWGQYGMELRYPMLDSRLIEFVLALPLEQRATGRRKSILKDALQDMIPQEILQKRLKHGDWTKEMDEVLHKLCAKTVPEPVANRSGMMQEFVDLSKVKVLIDRYKAGHYDDTRSAIWRLVALDHWLSVFMQGALDEGKIGQEEIHLAQAH